MISASFSALLFGQCDARGMPCCARGSATAFQCPLVWAVRCKSQSMPGPLPLMVPFQCPLVWAVRCKTGCDSVTFRFREFQCPLVWAVRCKAKAQQLFPELQIVSVPSCLGSAMQACDLSGEFHPPFRFQCPLVWAVRCKQRGESRTPSPYPRFQCPLVWAVRCKSSVDRIFPAVELVSVPSCLGSAMQGRCRCLLPDGRLVSVPSCLGSAMQGPSLELD